MTAAGEAKVIPIESAPSWAGGEQPAHPFAERLAGSVATLLSGRLGPAAESVLGKGWEDRAANGLAFLRRRITGDYEVDEFGFDQELTEEVLLSLLRPLADKYFRIEVRGIENIPTEGGVLVVANHSGVVPLDALMTQVAIHDHHPARRHLRMLAADLVFVLPVVGELARKAGHTLACNEDAQALLERGEVVGVWPEGFKGSASRSPTGTSCSGSAAAASSPRRCGPRCRSCPARSSGPRRPTRCWATRRRWPGCSACRTCRSPRPSPGSARSARSRCRPSGPSSSAPRSPPTSTRRRRRRTRCWSST
jgi:hypothetical protein